MHTAASSRRKQRHYSIHYSLRSFQILASVPSTFQKITAEILKRLPAVQNYLDVDDLIVYSKTAVEQDHKLKAVLQKLKEVDCCLMKTGTRV